MYQRQENLGKGERSVNGIQNHQQPLLSRIRNLNHFNFTSLGSLFSGNVSSKAKLGKQDVRRGSESEASDYFYELGRLNHGATRPTCALETDDGSQVNCNCHVLEDSGNLPCTACCCSTNAHDEAMSNQRSIFQKPSKKAHTFTRFPEMRTPLGYFSTASSRFSLDTGNRFNFGDIGNPDGDAYPQSISSSEPLACTAVFPSLPSSTTSAFYGSDLSSPFESESASVSHQQGLSRDPGTPPLTPDLSNHEFLPLENMLTDASLPSFSRFSFQFNSLNDSDEFLKSYDSEDNGVYTGRCLREIKEGKKPERIVDQNINGEVAVCNAIDDPEEWYGLEYTLEVSSRERQPSSESQSFCVGEHSKSRESWAALHRGTIHPFFEDEDYRQWKNWHYFLDRQDERKRHKKALEFRIRARDLAWIYVDEVRTRDVLHWQKEVFGVVARDIKERLQFLVERRPDPYRPPQEHNLAWYLKRSRSVACLRELESKPLIAVDRRL